MRHISTLFGQLIRLCRISAPTGGPLYPPLLVDRMAARFEFAQLPTPQELDYQRGIKFQTGTLGNGSLIESIQFFNNGLIVEARNSTDFCIEISKMIFHDLQDIGCVIEFPEDISTLYMSEIETKIDVNAVELVERFEKFGEYIGGVISGYNNIQREDLHFYGAQWRVGPGRSTPAFRIELSERKDAPVGTYFSSASLSTPDHISAIEKLEQLLG